MTDETPVDVLPADVSPAGLQGVPVLDDAGSNVIPFPNGGGPSPPKPNPFTQQDANNILILAERAPLQNLQEARAIQTSIQRFVQFVNASNVPQA